jgi:tetratricopeptide (TPR) repeat protein
VKAERKFSELLAQFPNGPVTLDAQLWFLKTLHRLDKFEDAETAGELLIEAATGAEEPAIAGEASVTLAEVAEEQNNPSLAVQRYEKAVELLDDGFERATIQAKVGDILMTLQEYHRAMAAYQKVGGYTSDIYLLYYGRLQSARAARELKENERALDLFDELLGDFRFFQYENVIRFEVGKTLALNGEITEAIEQYRYVDTTFVRTEIGVKAAYELGKLLQYQVGDYMQAKVAYEHASNLPALEESRLAQKRNVALSRYFELQRTLNAVDSLLSVHENDSLWQLPDTMAVLQGDSLIRELVAAVDTTLRDSTGMLDSTLALRSDSLSSDSTAAFVPPMRLKPDSLRAVLSGIAYGLGELFYSELEIPDSSFFWYNESLRLHQDSLRAGRTFFILAEIIRSNPEKEYGDSDELYRRLIREAPGSAYAEEARARLGIPKPARDIDPAQSAFARAESLLVSGKHSAALEAWKDLVRLYPKSPFAAKSDFALAWLYEKHLSMPDSALAYYKRIVEQYGSTEYSKVAMRRIIDPEADSPAPQQAAPDSLAKSPVPQADPAKPVIELDPDEERLFNARSDTSKTRRGKVKEVQ